MRILQLHANYMEYQPIKKEIEKAEAARTERVKVTEVVVVFTSIEEADDRDTATKAADELAISFENLRARRILIYPYSHLSTSLAAPDAALQVLKELASQLENKGYEVYRGPFGWTKSFTISVKGHPLAEQAKTISGIGSTDENVLEALELESKPRSSFHILSPNGDTTNLDSYDFSGRDQLKKLSEYEQGKSRVASTSAPHISLMRRLGLADYEMGSDSGNLRFYPKGRFVKSLLENYVTKMVKRYGAMEVETPIMYDSSHPSLKDYLKRFPARQYLIRSDEKDLFLRFSACFGQFLMAKDAQFSYRQLPLKLYELTRYSFRREKRGELVGLRRLRAFTMPDCHALCKDMSAAMEEVLIRFDLSRTVLRGIGLEDKDYELAIRVTEEFYNKNFEFVNKLVKMWGRPVLMEVWKERFFYFIFKWEFNFIDSNGKASALSTDQIDVENAERYGITYTDEQGSPRNPVILHNSPSGAIERCIYAFLERAAKSQGLGIVPSLPFWLSPTQVRLIPISEDYLSKAIECADTIAEKGLRVDVDDRESSVGKKVRDAEKEWIKFIVVIGKNETHSGILQVRDREKKEMISMTVEDLEREWQALTAGHSKEPLPLPRMVSKRAKYS